MRSAERYLGVVLILAVLAAMGRIAFNEFSWWDDPSTLHQNPHFNPPTLAGVVYYWRHAFMELYVPVTYTVWGALAKLAYAQGVDGTGIHLNPFVFHSASLVVHMASSLLVFGILQTILANRWAACIGALLFAVHPVQVEAVAWTSGLKDLLAGFFCFVALGQYLRFAQAPRLADGDPEGAMTRPMSREARTRHYIVALAAFELAMLSKPGTMVAPAMAAVLDYFVARRGIRAIIVSLAPWGVLAFACAAVTKAVQPAPNSPIVALWARPIVAADALSFYVSKLACPVRLCVNYGRNPQVALQSAWIYFTAVVPIALGAALWYWRRQHPLLGMAAVLSVIAVSPVLGFVRFDFQSYSTVADHYLYVAMLGPAVVLGWLASRLGRRGRIGILGYLLVMGCVSSSQAGHWKNPTAMWAHETGVNPRSWSAYNNYGVYLNRKGQSDAAADQWRQAIRIKPSAIKPRGNLAKYLLDRGYGEEAILHLRAAVKNSSERTPATRAKLYTDLGSALLKMDHDSEAVEALQEAVAIAPGSSDAAGLLRVAQSKIRGRASTQPSVSLSKLN